MNFQFAKQPNNRASILVITLFIGSAIGIALGSYLLLFRAQNVAVVRSQAWNSALTMAEAGAEEALAQLNPGAVEKIVSVDRTANGWGSPAHGVYGPISRNLTNSSYSVLFTDVTFPVIYSTGYVTVPNLSVTLSRVVRVATTNVPLFNVSLAARTNITLSGNGVSTDSFDSSSTNLSTNGRYDPSKTSTNGDIAVLYGTAKLGNHNINGDLYLGPTANVNGSRNQVSGNIYTDFNSDFPAVVLPPGSGSWTSLLLPLPGIVNGVLYNYVFSTS